MSGQQAIVFYDAECPVCNAFRRWLKRRDGHDRLRMLPNDAANVRQHAPGLDPATAERMLVTVFPDSRMWKGARGVFGAAAETGGLCGAVCRVMSWKPLSLLAEPGYRLFARHRGRLARFFPEPEIE